MGADLGILAIFFVFAIGITTHVYIGIRHGIFWSMCNLPEKPTRPMPSPPLKTKRPLNKVEKSYVAWYEWWQIWYKRQTAEAKFKVRVLAVVAVGLGLALLVVLAALLVVLVGG